MNYIQFVSTERTAKIKITMERSVMIFKSTPVQYIPFSQSSAHITHTVRLRTGQAEDDMSQDLVQSKLFTTTPLPGSTTTCYYDQVVVVTSTFCAVTSEQFSVCAVVVGRVMLYISSDFVKRLHSIVHLLFFLICNIYLCM